MEDSVSQAEPSVQSRHTNGNAMKQEETTAALLRMGFPPQAVGPSKSSEDLLACYGRTAAI